MTRRVLVVAYFFPPLGGVGVQRTLKYVKYLPQNGWQPVVVTPARPAYTVRDASLLDELPADIQVERTGSFEPARLPIAVAARLSRGRAHASGAAESAASKATIGPAGAGLAARALAKGMGAWKSVWGLLLFPDAAAGWVGPATSRGLAVHRLEPFDAIYSTSGPISCHLIAGKIAARTGLPWIADFRDPWIGNAFAKPVRGLHAIQQRRMERRIVERADRVIFATQGLLDAYSARYPEAAGKMLLIPNGYDRADFAIPADGLADADRAGTPPSRRPFRLVYTGSFYGERELGVFLDGLEMLLGRRPEVKDQLEVEFVGWLSAHNRAIAAEYSSPARLGSMLRFSGFVAHADAIRKAASADALLQIIADDPRKGEVQGGKLMEYLGHDRQILAVVPEGAARDVLRELDWGIIADPTPDGVAAGLERLLDEPPPQLRADPDGRYDRVSLAARLAACLDETVEAARR
jgi:glycosyltransferase involved in cell wall biosynthesis